MPDRLPIVFTRRFDLVALLGVSALCAIGCTQEGRERSPLPGNPVPEIASVDPTFALAGQGPFMLTVRGEGFDADSLVRWNGSDRLTSLVSIDFTELALHALILDVDVAVPDTAEITVFNPLPGGGESNAVHFRVRDQEDRNPVPAITFVDPSEVSSNSDDFVLTVNGRDFVVGASVVWIPANQFSGFTEATTFVSSSRLTALIPAGHIGSAGGAKVRVVNPEPGGGTSNSEPVTVF